MAKAENTTTTSAIDRRRALAVVAGAIGTGATVLASGAEAGALGLKLPTVGNLPDRKAMEAYATWLHYERRLLCMELYPDAGCRAENWISMQNAGADWHFPLTTDWKDWPQPSTRAAAVLGLVGVDWAGYPDERCAPEYRDSGDRPDMPGNWPQVDPELTSAQCALNVYDLALAGLHDRFGDDADSRDDYGEISDARSEALETLASVQARSRNGIEAKALAIKALNATDYRAVCDIAASLADDLLRIPGGAHVA